MEKEIDPKRRGELGKMKMAGPSTHYGWKAVMKWSFS